MRRIAASILCLGAIAACTITGCGGGGTEGQPLVEQGSTKLPPKVVDVSTLPKLKGYIPPLDEGHVEFNAPEGWHPLSRREPYLVVFAPDGKTGKTPPRILITADDAPGNPPSSFSAAEVDKFEAYIMPLLDADLKTRKDVREPLRMVVIGDRPWARYVLGRSMKGMPIDGQVLKTVGNGRIYTMELQVAFIPGKIEYRDEAYAVAAGVKFPEVAVTEGDGTGEDSLGDLLGNGDPEEGEDNTEEGEKSDSDEGKTDDKKDDEG